MPRMNALGVPLLMLAGQRLTSDTWVDIDPSTFDPEQTAEFENLRMRGLIGLHPDDNGGIPVGKVERASLPVAARTTQHGAPPPPLPAPPRPATPMPSADDREIATTRDDKPTAKPTATKR